MLAAIQFRVATRHDRCRCGGTRAPKCADVKLNTTVERPAATHDQVTTKNYTVLL
jgi:hypothetical protein